jgi:magnesium-transporting ATPase (P-type)
MDPWSLSIYNTLITLFPSFLLGITDYDMTKEEIYNNPKSYNLGRKNQLVI